MAQSGQDEDKQHEATQKKLDDARKRGEIPRSADLTAAAAYFGLLIAATAVGATSLNRLGATLSGLVERAYTLSTDLFSGGGRAFLGGLLAEFAATLAPWFLIPGAAALLTIVATRSFAMAPEKLQMKLNRISPLSNAKNKFGRSGLFEFAKSFVKLMLYSIILAVFLWRQMPVLIEAVALTPAMVAKVLLDLCVRFFSLVLVIALAIGGIDFLWQRQEHLRKNRMSHKELTDEVKQNEGDPHLKQRRRQKGYDIATNRMLADVPEADVVVVNPLHYAVALKWDRDQGTAPVCVAKGVDEIAARIRERAMECGVPVHRDPPTARAIHAAVNIGNEIHPAHYQAIAAAIRFAEEMRRKTRLTTR